MISLQANPIGFFKRLFREIKEALNQPKHDNNRATRRQNAKLKGAKRTDGNFRGNPSLKEAVENARMLREIKKGARP